MINLKKLLRQLENESMRSDEMLNRKGIYYLGEIEELNRSAMKNSMMYQYLNETGEHETPKQIYQNDINTKNRLSMKSNEIFNERTKQLKRSIECQSQKMVDANKRNIVEQASINKELERYKLQRKQIVNNKVNSEMNNVKVLKK